MDDELNQLRHALNEERHQREALLSALCDTVSALNYAGRNDAIRYGRQERKIEELEAQLARANERNEAAIQRMKSMARFFVRRIREFQKQEKRWRALDAANVSLLNALAKAANETLAEQVVEKDREICELKNALLEVAKLSWNDQEDEENV